MRLEGKDYEVCDGGRDVFQVQCLILRYSFLKPAFPEVL